MHSYETKDGIMIMPTIIPTLRDQDQIPIKDPREKGKKKWNDLQETM
jgi:hypothetical protein